MEYLALPRLKSLRFAGLRLQISSKGYLVRKMPWNFNKYFYRFGFSLAIDTSGKSSNYDRNIDRTAKKKAPKRRSLHAFARD